MHQLSGPVKKTKRIIHTLRANGYTTLAEQVSQDLQDLRNENGVDEEESKAPVWDPSENDTDELNEGSESSLGLVSDEEVSGEVSNEASVSEEFEPMDGEDSVDIGSSSGDMAGLSPDPSIVGSLKSAMSQITGLETSLASVSDPLLNGSLRELKRAVQKKLREQGE